MSHPSDGEPSGRPSSVNLGGDVHVVAPPSGDELDRMINLADLERLRKEAARLEAEREKIDEERRKVQVEREELVATRARPWYRREKLIQAVIAGILALPAMWWFLTNIFLPAARVENVKLQYANDTTTLALAMREKRLAALDDSVKRTRLANQDATRALLAERARVRQTRDSVVQARRSVAAEQGRVQEANRRNQEMRGTLDRRDRELGTTRQQLGQQQTQLAAIRTELDTAALRLQALGEGNKQLKQGLARQLAHVDRQLERLLEGGVDARVIRGLRDSVAVFLAATSDKPAQRGRLAIRGGRLQGPGIRHAATPNRSGRFAAGMPDAVVLHATISGDLDPVVAFMGTTDARASTHVLIGREGQVVQLVSFDSVAWHAGRSQYGGRTGYNQLSIGIHLVNAGPLRRDSAGSYRPGFGRPVSADDAWGTENDRWQRYTPIQLELLEEIVARLAETYAIREVVTHDDVRTDGRRETSPQMPVARLRQVVAGARRVASRPAPTRG